MAEELQFHIQRRAEDLAASQGLDAADAARRARLEFGAMNRYKEEARQSLGLRLVDEWRNDLRYAWRTLWRNKGFAVAAVATLAVGIGANTAIFSVLNAVILRPLPVQRPDELVEVSYQRPGRSPESGFANALWEAVRDHQDVFSGIFAWMEPRPLAVTQGASTGPAQVLMVSGDFFGTLGVGPGAGRLISRADDRRGCSPVAVLSDAFWSRQFSRSPAALGDSLHIGQHAFAVIGVTTPRFTGVNVGSRFDLAIPICAAALLDKRNVESAGRQWLAIAGRLEPGTTLEQASARLAMLSPAIMAAAATDEAVRAPPDLQRTIVAVPGPIGAGRFRRIFLPSLQLLMAIVAMVLVIASANIAGLMAARAATRDKEISVRAALGASRGRLVRQMLTEAAAICVLGALGGLALAHVGSELLVNGLSTADNPIYLDHSLDVRVLAVTAVVTIVTTLLIGLAPAVRSTRAALIDAMKTRLGTGGSRAGFRAGKWIVAGQVALSLLLLVAGGLLLRTFVNLARLDLGFDRSHLLVVSARQPWYATDLTPISLAEKPAVYGEIARRLETVPGVTSVARAYTTPIGDTNWVTRLRTDSPASPSGQEAATYLNFVSPGYFGTLRMPLVAGRDFNRFDSATSPPVAIVNETLARRFFPDGGALGGRFRRGNAETSTEIIGIVRDAKYETVRQPIPPTAFIPETQMPEDEAAEVLVLRTAVPPASLIPTVRRVAADVRPEVSLTASTIEERIADNLARERVIATLAGFFGLVGLVLAMVGLYGALSYLVAERRAEFGIRMAIGAPRASVLRLVMKDVVVVLAVGLIAGSAAVWPGTRLLEQLLYGLEPRDGTTILLAAALLAAVVLLAGYLPARRATRIDPVPGRRHRGRRRGRPGRDDARRARRAGPGAAPVPGSRARGAPPADLPGQLRAPARRRGGGGADAAGGVRRGDRAGDQPRAARRARGGDLERPAARR